MSAQEREQVCHSHITIFVFIQKHKASTHTLKVTPDPLPSNTKCRMISSSITFVMCILWFDRDSSHLRFCSITSRSGVEEISVSCSCEASDWLSSSDVALSFLKNVDWVRKPFPSSSYLCKSVFYTDFNSCHICILVNAILILILDQLLNALRNTYTY